MGIQWTSDLATGSREIDGQHKQIFIRINEMLDACGRGKGKEKVGGLLAFLEDYVITHFGAEERYMELYRYPGHADHKVKHDELIKQLATLKMKVEKEGVGVHTVVATNQLIVSWFVNHIRNVDTQLVAFLKTVS